ncbi:1068_t:CDS:2 [Ambispora leptoticha]|uniref:1068_t:CDS:1 n=1 Tax=Ambispora leptoticha TaxID=144679 RepID=A0A9N8VRA6_9GLOM|nr:1068_t:CDS:2 [Ambispora leptoticha]
MSKIIFLNGCASAGKTTLAKEIQNLSKEKYLYIPIDTLFGAMPKKIVGFDQKAEEGFRYVIDPKTEPGETPLEAAKREVFEETNLVIEDLEIVGEQAFNIKNQNYQGFLVKAHKYSGEIKIKELDKITDIQFKTIDYEFAVNRLFYAIIFEVDY